MGKIILFVSLQLIVFTGSFAAETEINNNTALFKIGRSKDSNEIYYTVKTTPEGSLDLSEPVHMALKLKLNVSLSRLTVELSGSQRFQKSNFMHGFLKPVFRWLK
ncbi:MAG: hypothetical protein Q8N05_18670 [Bacteroidota bacterium]|nr:hypothetical protein [Bacteroidota bacterium]